MDLNEVLTNLSNLVKVSKLTHDEHSYFQKGIGGIFSRLNPAPSEAPAEPAKVELELVAEIKEGE